MGTAVVARGCASAAAVLAGGAGFTAFAAALYWLFSSASLDLSDSRHWHHVAALAMTGAVLSAYAAVHAAFRWQPASARAVAARAALTVTGGALLVRSAVNAPPAEGCGMAWLANLAPLGMVMGFAVVEAAAWAGWWAAGVREAEPVAAADGGT